MPCEPPYATVCLLGPQRAQGPPGSAPSPSKPSPRSAGGRSSSSTAMATNPSHSRAGHRGSRTRLPAAQPVAQPHDPGQRRPGSQARTNGPYRVSDGPAQQPAARRDHRRAERRRTPRHVQDSARHAPYAIAQYSASRIRRERSSRGVCTTRPPYTDGISRLRGGSPGRVTTRSRRMGMSIRVGPTVPTWSGPTWGRAGGRVRRQWCTRSSTVRASSSTCLPAHGPSCVAKEPSNEPLRPMVTRSPAVPVVMLVTADLQPSPSPSLRGVAAGGWSLRR